MYAYLDKLLTGAKKRLKTEFNRIGVMGFDELNVTNTKKVTKAMFDRLLESNEALYLKAAKSAYKKAKEEAKEEGFTGEKETPIGAEWIGELLTGYNFVTGYLYDREAERKRLRLNEQILTAREYGDHRMLEESARRSANLFWTQTVQYGISSVDEATITAFEDAGVKSVRWVTAKDEKRCEVCGARDGKVYKLKDVPAKPHYGCRCRIVPEE